MDLSDDDEDKKRDPLKHMNFQEKLNNVLGKLKINASAKHLINATFYSWESFDNCRAKIPESSKEELRDFFEEFKIKRAALVVKLSEIGIEAEKLEESDFIYHWFQGTESLEHFLSSEETQEWFTESEITNIRLNVLDWNDEKATSETSVQLTEIDSEKRLKSEVLEELKPGFSQMQSRPSSSFQQASRLNISIASSQNQQNDLNKVSSVHSDQPTTVYSSNQKPEKEEKLIPTTRNTESGNAENEGRSWVESKNSISVGNDFEKTELNQKKTTNRQEPTINDRAERESKKYELSTVSRTNEDHKNLTITTEQTYRHVEDDKKEIQTEASTSEAHTSKSSATMSSDQSDAKTSTSSEESNAAKDETSSFETQPEAFRPDGRNFEQTQLKSLASKSSATTSSDQSDAKTSTSSEESNAGNDGASSLETQPEAFRPDGRNFEQTQLKSLASKSSATTSSDQSHAKTSTSSEESNAAKDETSSLETQPEAFRPDRRNFERTQLKSLASKSSATTSSYKSDAKTSTSSEESNAGNDGAGSLETQPEASRPDGRICEQTELKSLASESPAAMSSDQSDAKTSRSTEASKAANDGASSLETQPEASRPDGRNFEQTELKSLASKSPATMSSDQSDAKTSTSSEASKAANDGASSLDTQPEASRPDGRIFEQTELKSLASKSPAAMSSDQSDAKTSRSTEASKAANNGAGSLETQPEASHPDGHNFEQTELKSLASKSPAAMSSDQSDAKTSTFSEASKAANDGASSLETQPEASRPDGRNFEQTELKSLASKSPATMSSDQSDAKTSTSSEASKAAIDGTSSLETQPEASRPDGRSFEQTELKSLASKSSATTSSDQSDAKTSTSSEASKAANDGASSLETQPEASRPDGHNFEQTELKSLASKSPAAMSSDQSDAKTSTSSEASKAANDGASSLETQPEASRPDCRNFKQMELKSLASKSPATMSSDQSDAKTSTSSEASKAANDGASSFETQPEASRPDGRNFEQTELKSHTSKSSATMSSDQSDAKTSTSSEKSKVANDGANSLETQPEASRADGRSFEQTELKSLASKSSATTSSDQSDAKTSTSSEASKAANDGASSLETQPEASRPDGHNFEQTELKSLASKSPAAMSSDQSDAKTSTSSEASKAANDGASSLETQPEASRPDCRNFKQMELKSLASKSPATMSSDQSDAKTSTSSEASKAANDGASSFETQPEASRPDGRNFEQTELKSHTSKSSATMSSDQSDAKTSTSSEKSKVANDGASSLETQPEASRADGRSFEQTELKSLASKSPAAMSSYKSDAKTSTSSEASKAANDGASSLETQPGASRPDGRNFEQTELKSPASKSPATMSSDQSDAKTSTSSEASKAANDGASSLETQSEASRPDGRNFEQTELKSHTSKSSATLSSDQSDAKTSTSSEKSKVANDGASSLETQPEASRPDGRSFEQTELKSLASKSSATMSSDQSDAKTSTSSDIDNQNRVTGVWKQTNGSEVKIVPLIVCSEVIQDGSKVYKFNIDNTGFQYLKQLGHLGYEVSSKTGKDEDIDLDQLNKTSLRLVGIIGPFQAVINIFETRFNSETVEKIKLINCFEQSGLFLVKIENEENLFVVYYSKNDEDFGPVKKESKIVHFLRYLSELTNQVILCPIETNVDIFPKKSSLVDTKIKRMRKFTSHETSQEAAAYQLTELGHFPCPEPDTTDVFTSNSAFCIISQLVKPQASRKEEKSETKNISQMKDFLKLKQIDQKTDIDAQFKIDFIKMFHPQTWKQIQQSIDKDLDDDKSLSNECTRKLMLQAIALYFIRDEFSLEYKLTEGFYSDKQNGHYDLWEMHSSDEKLVGAIEKTQMVELKSKISNSTNPTKHSIKKQLLICALEAQQNKLLQFFRRNPNLSELSWENLRKEARNDVFESDDEAIDLLIAEEAEKASKSANSSWMKEKLPKFVEYFSKKIEKLSSAKQTKQIFVAYLKEVHLKRVEKLRKKLTIDYTNSSFSNMIERKKESSEKITRIISTENKAGEYEIFSEENVLVPPQKEIKISFPGLDSAAEAGILEGNGTVLQNIQFNEIDTLVLEENESLVSAHPTQTKSVVICLNKHQPLEETLEQKTQYLAKIIVVPEAIEITSIRHNISTNSFDCHQRKLALSCQDNPNIIYLITFEPSFRIKSQTSQMDLEKLIGNVSSIQLSFQYQSSFLWVFCRQDLGQFLYKFNYHTTELVLSVKLNETPANISCTPCGLAMFHFLQSNKTAQLTMSATGTPFQDPFVYPRPLENIQITSISDQNVIVQKHERKLFFSTIEITGTKQTTFKPAQNQTADSSNQTFEWHWIRSIYMMFNKFPCTDLMDRNQNLTRLWIVLSSDVSSLFLENIESEIERVQSELKKTKKPLDLMRIQVEQMQEVTPFLSDFLQQKPLIKKLLGSLIIKLITFIPKQIARSQSNELVLMNDGDPLSLKTVQNAIELAALINFGFYEKVFKLWTGDVKVISSMGKQSTGKSFTLNHLTGLSFNISGARCTDGCWMSVKLTDKCLYVILDFEGLGSFERTDQDDMLLSLLNSAISSITLFKCEKRLERDVEKLFQNMNLGCNQLKGTEHLFRGFFMIVINDVDDSDIDETTREFEKKMKLILNRSQMNFLSTLYGSGYIIFPFPMFSTKSYYDATEELHSTVCSSVSPLFKNGEAFMGSLKLIMAKLTIGDFTPLGRQQIDERLSYLQSKFQFAVIFGQICRKEPKTPDYRLKKIGDQKFEIQTEKMIDLPAIGPIMIEDLEMTFSEQFTAATVRRFIKILSLSHDSIKVWRISLEKFTVECISFRFARVKRWLNENLKPWENSENPEIKDLIQSMFENWESWHFKYQQKYRFCDEKCAKCFLKCTHIVDHDANLEHECSSDHKCEETCAHCQTQSSKECGLKFGHEGQHNCMQIRHVCNEPCKYNSLNGCEGKCQKEVDHIDFHQCSQKSHKCKHLCSLETCSGNCIVEADIPHSVHKCSRNNCDSACSVDGCPNKCESEDHFHGNSMGSRFRAEQQLLDINLLYAGHFCGKEHACHQNCQKKGFCHKVVERAEEEKTYQGQRSFFNYNLKFKEFGKKMQCRIKIPPFEKHHQGDHVCSSIFHTCTVQCPTCDNYCNKRVEHQMNENDFLHDTRHGNMVTRHFLANHGEFEIGAHKYAVGESSVAEMCHIFCNELGRGHVHVVNCKTDKNSPCQEIKGEKRHQTTKYWPDISTDKDEMTHKAYWSSINFTDPCSAEAQVGFGKCPAFCSSQDHDEGSERSYCNLAFMHEPAKSLTGCGVTVGFIKKGHIFTCTHAVKRYHFTLYLSNSDSIQGRGGKKLIKYVTKFANRRLELANEDQISVVLFCKHTTYVIANHIEVADYDASKVWQINEQTDEGTEFEKAMRIVRKQFKKGYKNPDVFTSDGLSEEHYKQMISLYSEVRGTYFSGMKRSKIEEDYKVTSARYPPSVGVSV